LCSFKTIIRFLTANIEVLWLRRGSITCQEWRNECYEGVGVKWRSKKIIILRYKKAGIIAGFFYSLQG